MRRLICRSSVNDPVCTGYLPSIKRFLDEQFPATRLRTIMERDSGHDTGLWQGLVELGITGLNISANYGGSARSRGRGNQCAELVTTPGYPLRT